MPNAFWEVEMNLKTKRESNLGKHLDRKVQNKYRKADSL